MWHYKIPSQNPPDSRPFPDYACTTGLRTLSHCHAFSSGILCHFSPTVLPVRSEEKREKQTKLPAFSAVQVEEIFEENVKAEQQPVNQSEQKPEKKTSLLRKLDEKKKECAERDAKQQAVREKRNHEMSL